MANLVEPMPGAERRAFPRLFRSTEVKFRNFLKPHKEFRGTLSKDISAGGLRVSAETFLAKDDRLVLLVELPGYPEPIRTIGQVAWQRHRSHSDVYEFGVEFLEITDHDQEAIATYVERGVVTPQAPPTELS